MPNTQSAKKRLRQDDQRRGMNQAAKTRIRTETKKAVAGEDNAAISVIDRAASKRVIHRNCAARKKSRLAKRLAAAE